MCLMENNTFRELPAKSKETAQKLSPSTTSFMAKLYKLSLQTQ